MMSLKEYKSTNTSYLRCSILSSLLLVMYIIENSRLASLVGSQLFNYVIKPLLWLGIIILVWLLPKVRTKGKLRHKGLVNLWALNLGGIFIVVNILAGLIDGFGKSPYSQKPIGIITNFFFVASVLVGRELIRNNLVNSLTKEENYKIFVMVSLFFTFLGISFTRYVNLSDFQELFVFIARYFAPEFVQNIMATYLVYIGGALPAIIYLGVIQAFHWFSPILPNLQWITAALIGILTPAFSLILFQGIYEKEAKLIKRSKTNEEEGPLGWLITSLISIVVVWFSVGVFSIYPSVIATGSMEPKIYPGDIIIVRKATSMTDINELEIGDVIQFKRDSILISHRIIEIIIASRNKKRIKGDIVIN